VPLVCAAPPLSKSTVANVASGAAVALSAFTAAGLLPLLLPLGCAAAPLSTSTLA
jgi:hypothetical protein